MPPTVTGRAGEASKLRMARCSFYFAVFAVSGVAAFAQIGGQLPNPGGPSYPGGPGFPGAPGYPGQQGGISLPGRKGKNTASTQATDTVSGRIRRISTSELILEPEDRRIITVALEKTTQYFTNSGPAKFGDLDVGDQVSVDASRDKNTYLHAVKVTLQKKAETGIQASAGSGPQAQIIDGDDNPAENRAATTMAPKPADRDRDDPGPPVLKRGIPPDINSASRGDTSANAPGATGRSTAPARQERTGKADPVIEAARESAFNFTETLPNYQVKQFTTRYETGTAQGARTQWNAKDVVTADVTYENGKESYGNLLINGKPSKEKIENTGSWSTGEFATVLRDILSPATDADFFNKRSSTVVNRAAWRYDYTVEQPTSHWRVVASSETYFPAYKGSIWVDKENSRVLRIEMSSRDMPKGFALDKVESTTEYDYVLIGSKKFLLPTHSESLSCITGTAVCSRNVIDFRNYRKFGADTDIKFDAQ